MPAAIAAGRSTAEGYTMDPDDAAVTVVEWGDYT